MKKVTLRFGIIIFIIIYIIMLIFLAIDHNKNNKETITETAIETIEAETITIVTTESLKNDETIDIYETTEPTTSSQELISLGEFKLTAYCSCGKCCGKWANNRPKDENGNDIVYGSIGERLTAGYSIAVDPDVIPYGTEVIINNHTYKAQDCGGAIDGNEVDIYFDDHQEALEFGVQYAEVFIVVK